MQLMYKKFTAALLAFLMIFSMGGMLCPLAQTNTSQAKTTQEPKVNGGDKVYINKINFPDDNFRNSLLYCTTYTTEGNDAYYTEDQIAAVTNIKCFINVGLSSLKGIEYFTSLKTLDCHYNNLTSLDLSNNTALKRLDCSNNQLTSLNLGKNAALESLDCCGNQLTSLDVSNDTALDFLECFANQLTSLDVSKNTALKHLDCRHNQLTSIDVSKNTVLDFLGCDYNQLTGLDVSKNTALTVLQCQYNQLTNLDISNNTALKTIYCESNQLTTLDLSRNAALERLDCSNNQLTSLDTSGLNLSNFKGENQTSTANCYYNDTNKQYVVFMPEVLGKNGDLTKVKITSSGWNYDPNTGMASYSSNGNDAPNNLSYNYATDDKGHQLQVDLNLIK